MISEVISLYESRSLGRSQPRISIDPDERVCATDRALMIFVSVISSVN